MNRAELHAALADPNVKAFLALIRAGEGTSDADGYRRCFGGELFDNFADHPRRTITKGGYTSTAAGAGQFLSRTWDGLVRQYGFPDFSPACQDEGIVALVSGRGALADVQAGRIEQAVAKCAREWASLPGSPYGQPTRTLKQALKTYLAAGGVLETTAELPLVQTEQIASTRLFKTASAPEGFIMPPFLLAALPSLIQSIPQLAKLFGADGEHAEKNVVAVQAVAQIVQNATGAKNIQEAVESIQAEPAMLQAATQAVQDKWFSLAESGGGGIDGARAADAAFVATGKPPIASPAFLLSIALLLFPASLAIDLFYVHPASYDATLRTQIITGFLMTIGIVAAYWLGSSFGSDKKTDAMTK